MYFSFELLFFFLTICMSEAVAGLRKPHFLFFLVKQNKLHACVYGFPAVIPAVLKLLYIINSTTKKAIVSRQLLTDMLNISWS